MVTSADRIAVAMSGGIDSTYAAIKLKEEGYEVTGVSLQLWHAFNKEEVNKNQDRLKRISDYFEFEIISISAEHEFRKYVIEYFDEALLDGLTPNPCIVCNKQIKFGFLIETIQKFGFNFIATGHYVRTMIRKNGEAILLKGKDKHKDQSYYLCWLDQKKLQRCVFPLGEMNKTDVINNIKTSSIHLEDVKESQDLCFLSGHDYSEYIHKYLPSLIQPGEIVDNNNIIIGNHNGLAFYTIGQRKGIGIAAKTPMYVMEKDIKNNRLIVGNLNDFALSATNKSSLVFY